MSRWRMMLLASGGCFGTSDQAARVAWRWLKMAPLDLIAPRARSALSRVIVLSRPDSFIFILSESVHSSRPPSR